MAASFRTAFSNPTAGKPDTSASRRQRSRKRTCRASAPQSSVECPTGRRLHLLGISRCIRLKVVPPWRKQQGGMTLRGPGTALAFLLCRKILCDTSVLLYPDCPRYYHANMANLASAWPAAAWVSLRSTHPTAAGLPLRLGGGEGRGEVGDSTVAACGPRPSRPHAGETPAVRTSTHLTLPRLRRGPLPLPLKGGEGDSCCRHPAMRANSAVGVSGR